MYKTEFILRHWQYTYNQYWDKAEAEYPDRPKLPCTIGGLRKALKSINQHNLLRKLSDIPGIPDEEYEPLEDMTTTPKKMIEQTSCEIMEDLTTTPKEIIEQTSCEIPEDLTTTPKEIIEQTSCKLRSYDNLAFSAEDCDSQDDPWQILLESSVNTEVFV